MSHTCHAIGCKKVIPPERLMCGPHWFMVPRNLRDRIWATYRVGQCDDWQPSAEYCAAAKAAVRAVGEREGLSVTGKEPELQLYDLFTPETSE